MKSVIKYAAFVMAATAALTGTVAVPAQAATVNKVLTYSCSFGLFPNLSNENALISFAGTFDDTAQVNVGTTPVDITTALSFFQSTATGLAAAGVSSIQIDGSIRLNVTQPNGTTVPLYLSHSFPQRPVSSGTIFSMTDDTRLISLYFRSAGTAEYRLSNLAFTATLKNSSGATLGTSEVTCTVKPNQDNLVTTTVVS
ncbi:DUF6801 domain-containing protein [Actinomadura macrotermitis]|uniref:DUF6801 domain-containing protein n=1 Tax=Actinomadura macrotermitis TaxID=2585200 RepID=A0A7K0BTM7_9ACTN|nr:DUF6801 domain-containing protein [Actinomadura macrotermitis]MQY04545.1 hypothetical protein [Actinomadura macrotermitis]